MAGDRSASDGDVRSLFAGSAANVVQGRDFTGDVHFHDNRVAARAAARVAPRELPRLPSGFTNRTAELRLIDGITEGSREACPVIVVKGTAGVGKTSLGLRWAHDAAGRYPDGQLYLNLRGYHELDPIAPDAALRSLLESLGTAPSAVPAEADRCAALYRSLMADAKRIVFLDNASTA